MFVFLGSHILKGPESTVDGKKKKKKRKGKKQRASLVGSTLPYVVSQGRVCLAVEEWLHAD